MHFGHYLRRVFLRQDKCRKNVWIGFPKCSDIDNLFGIASYVGIYVRSAPVVALGNALLWSECIVIIQILWHLHVSDLENQIISKNSFNNYKYYLKQMRR